MKLNQIRDIIATADSGSLRAAARQLGVTQPAITRSIRELERELGVPLFERHQFGMQPTAMGQVMLKRARAVQEELRRATEEIGQLQGEMNGEVRVAMSAISTFALMPPAVKSFRRAHPKAILKITESFYAPIESQLLNGEIDFFVGPFSDPGRGSRVMSEMLFKNERVVIVRKGHPLAQISTIRDLGDTEWVKQALPDRESEGDFERPFSQLGLPMPRIVMHTTSSTATLLAVANSDLLTSVPKQMLNAPVSSELFDVLPIREELDAAPICLVRRVDLSLTPLAEFMFDMFRRAGLQHSRKTEKDTTS
ncbi:MULTISPECIES: LysR substrate-binding domain-containing protein [Rhodobacterales]|uniref:LysR substrate-binding domain-containing protein n=1 Tax=Roseobacter sp. N2S TaxID=2663844 RepID=UPI002861493A|nr:MULTISPECIES: LysR substrate-binding domain-containing protein [Rhodobacterales]MDR6266888.1 DNA-binding transcriptional LysR family regulator [Roseobacter sp. N2S]